jgi:hypothetical protein
MEDDGFVRGAFHTHYLEDRQEIDAAPLDGDKTNEALLAAALLSHQRRRAGVSGKVASVLSNSGWRAQTRRAATERDGGEAWRNTF